MTKNGLFVWQCGEICIDQSWQLKKKKRNWLLVGAGGGGGGGS